ncbi:hypothetical protein MLD38_005620 [Melastoma candidum]|uniref:Uncharacterized protein n=1 Tax=Melastoma candidum TaxID=119954 RepID=A0ACB9RK01_9MYRT|nr:hypothetical protein MLD38_005620 [Melastoma candidum]
MPSMVTEPYLEFDSMTELPDSHAWAPIDHDPVGRDNMEEAVPVIDLEDPNVFSRMADACRSWGAFQVTNHGVPPDVLDGIERAGMDLFSLPLERKLRAARSPDGVTGYGVARIAPFFPKRMWSEGFTVIGSPADHSRQIWPHDYSFFCDIIDDYKKEMERLTSKLMGLILGSLGATKDDTNWESPSDCDAIQLNYYPICPDPDRAMGLAPHTDSTLFTILYQSNISGLQVLEESSATWIEVPPLCGALVIIVGDLLHILSNGAYASGLHRAVVNRTRHRLSVVYLHGPPSGVRVRPLPGLVDADRPPLYRPVTWSEYLGAKAKYFDKALSCVRICAPPMKGLMA